MSHFYGTLKGQAGATTRHGSRNSGLRTIAASWQGAVEVDLYESGGVDYARVSLKRWQGHGVEVEVYNGPVANYALADKAA